MALRIDGICHRFSKQQALHELSLCVESGDCYGFIGHNGAGKTTTMRIILGLLRPDSGRVVVDGFDAARHWREARARMGALIETPGFHGHWSGRRNLHLLDRLAGKRSDIDALIDLVGLAHAGSKPVRAYSQGMRQRLGVAQALLGDPDYILLDEPTNGLDPDGIREMRELLLRLTREQGRTVFISSHQLHELAGVCNRVAVIRTGRLVLEGSLDELLSGEQYSLRTGGNGKVTEVLAGMGLEVTGGDPYLVELAGHEPAVILRRLVDGGVEVSEFAPRAPTLEEIYYRREETEPAPRSHEVLHPPGKRIAPSRPVSRMVTHEFRRWLGQMTVPFLLALPTLVGIASMLVRREGVLGDQEEIMAGDLASATDVNAFEGVARSLHSGLWLLSYVVLGLASLSVAGEFAQGTLRNVLLRPLRRLQIAFGKWLALLGASLFSYVLLAGTSVAVAAWAFDFTGVFEILPNGKRFELVKAEEIWPDFKRVLVSPLLPLVAYAGIGFLAGSVVRRGAAALSFALGLGIFLDLGRDFARGSALEAWFPPVYMPSLGRSSFVDYFLEVSQGISNATFQFGDTDVLVPVVWALAAFALAALALKRRYVP